MAKSKPKNSNIIRKHFHVLVIVGAALLVSAAVLGWATYRETPREKPATFTTNSKPGYVDGSNATDHVSNFYQQYLNPNTRPDFLPKLIEAYGNKNLVFYSQYYQHGFNPITCSTTPPKSVTASLVSTGPVATVNAIAEYPDNSKQTLAARVVLDDEGLSIDSITCPGEKGNLPPTQ